MVVFYDVLLVDDRSLLGTQHFERYKILESLVHCEPGWAELVQRQVIDFNHRHAAASLRKMFAETIVSKGEGLVLKPNGPYFNFSNSVQPHHGCCIKLKKEYIGNFGEVGDFAAVGAGYDPAKAKSYNIPNLKWTHFYVGCLDNKEEVRRWSAMPRFTVVNMVELNETMLKTLIIFGNPMPVPIEENRATELTMSRVDKQPQLTVAFTNPVVFDVRCFSFDKEGNTGFWSPRFPQVSKIHFDRDFTNCVSFDELQAMAKEATNVEPPNDSQENLDWIARLQAADPRGIAVDAVSEATESQTTRTSMSSQGYYPLHLSQRMTDRERGRRTTSVSSTSTQDSPTRCRGCKDQSLVGSQLRPLTPPTSSPYPENAGRKPGGGCGTKRSSSSTVTDKLLKKRKSLMSNTPSITASVKDKTSAPRQPLGVIDPNSSQVSISSTKHESEILELSPIVETAPFFNEWFEIAALTTSQPFSTTSEPLRGDGPCEVIVISDDEDDTQQQKSDESLQATQRPQGGVRSSASFSMTIRKEPQPLCTYAGYMCQFATKAVLVAPHLFLRPEQETSDLLAAHGLKSRMINARTWLDSIRKAAESVQLGLQEGEIVMLVDCLEHDDEMNSILEEMEDMRSVLYPDNRNWITIYDWRVLKHISVLEDDKITRKYYDGFSNPWKRWHCGLV
jgi:DNA ligase 4